MKTVITFRLRKELDADLIGLQISDAELANLCRDGLRMVLGIKSKKMLQVVERPILRSSTPAVHAPSAPPEEPPIRVAPISGKPVVFVPTAPRTEALPWLEQK